LAPQDARSGVPLQQLVIALQKGKTRKAFNLVQILLDVKKQIHQEQVADKLSLKQQLDSFYHKEWALQRRSPSTLAYPSPATCDSPCGGS
jgi:hypothetical protein